MCAPILCLAAKLGISRLNRPARTEPAKSRSAPRLEGDCDTECSKISKRLAFMSKPLECRGRLRTVKTSANRTSDRRPMRLGRPAAFGAVGRGEHRGRTAGHRSRRTPLAGTCRRPPILDADVPAGCRGAPTESRSVEAAIAGHYRTRLTRAAGTQRTLAVIARRTTLAIGAALAGTAAVDAGLVAILAAIEAGRREASAIHALTRRTGGPVGQLLALAFLAVLLAVLVITVARFAFLAFSRVCVGRGVTGAPLSTRVQRDA